MLLVQGHIVKIEKTGVMRDPRVYRKSQRSIIPGLSNNGKDDAILSHNPQSGSAKPVKVSLNSSNIG